MADVIPIEPHLPVVNKELVDTLRSMLSEAQNGRLRSYLAIYLTGDGNDVGISHYYQCFADQLALEAVASRPSEEE